VYKGFSEEDEIGVEVEVTKGVGLYLVGEDGVKFDMDSNGMKTELGKGNGTVIGDTAGTGVELVESNNVPLEVESGVTVEFAEISNVTNEVGAETVFGKDN